LYLNRAIEEELKAGHQKVYCPSGVGGNAPPDSAA
jgi:hypothetical protein